MLYIPVEKVSQIIEAWKYLWTTERDRYILVHDEVSPVTGYTIHRIPDGLSLIIEDEDEYKIVVEHMLKAKMQIIDIHEYINLYFPKSSFST